MRKIKYIQLWKDFSVKPVIIACLMGVVSLGLAGCDEKASEERASDRAAQEITNRIQEPQNRARDLERQMLEQDQQRREAIDRM